MGDRDLSRRGGFRSSRGRGGSFRGRRGGRGGGRGRGGGFGRGRGGGRGGRGGRSTTPSGPQIPQSMGSEILQRYGASNRDEEGSQQAVSAKEVESSARFKSLRSVNSRKAKRKAAKVEKKARTIQFHQRRYGANEPEEEQAPASRKRKRDDDSGSVDDIDDYSDEAPPLDDDEELDSDLESDDEAFWASVRPPTKKAKASEDSARPTATKASAVAKAAPKAGKQDMDAKLAKLIRDDAEDDKILKDLQKKLGKNAKSEFDFLLAGITSGKRKLATIVGEKDAAYDPKALFDADENAEDILQYVEDMKEKTSGSSGNNSNEGSSGDEYMKVLTRDSGRAKKEKQFNLPEDSVDDSEIGSGSVTFDSMHAEDGDSHDMGDSDAADVEMDEYEEQGEADDEEQAPEEETEPEQASAAAAAPNASKYVPPHLRNAGKAGPVDASEAKMKKELKGMLNKLSEGNLTQIAQLIEKLFQTNSRGSVINAVGDHILEDCITSVGAAQVLTTTLVYSALLTYLHIVIGIEVGGFIVERIAVEFDKRYKDGEVDVCKNLLLMLIYLYSFKVVHHVLMYGIANLLVSGFQESDMDLLLLMFKNCGALLRSEDPTALKDLIAEINSKATQAREQRPDKPKAEGVSLSRLDYMLELMSDLKLNKMKMQDKSMLSGADKFKKSLDAILKARFKTVPHPDQLKITWNDLVSNQSKGRWWLVGSPFALPSDLKTGQSAIEASQKGLLDEYDSEVLKLAAAQRMNTDVRRAIFCALMTSEDYVDAFEKLMHMQLKQKQDREIVHVLLHCCQAEKTYNPFYAHLANKFCGFDHNYKITFKYALWDRLKIMAETEIRGVANLAKLFAYLFAKQAIPFGYLKVVDFDSLDAKTVIFLRRLLNSLFLENTEETIRSVFNKLGAMKEKTDQSSLDAFRQGLVIFFVQSLHGKEQDETKKQQLDAMAKLAKKSMRGLGASGW